jgi:hypothetical protein
MAVLTMNEMQPRAQSALTNSPFYELHELRVEEREGALFLSGVVSSFYHKQLAQEVVRSVCKGFEVVNAIRVDPETA